MVVFTYQLLGLTLLAVLVMNVQVRWTLLPSFQHERACLLLALVQMKDLNALSFWLPTSHAADEQLTVFV